MMATEYQKYEFCRAIECPEMLDSFEEPVCKETRCKVFCMAYKFHDYLQRQGYKIIKDKEK